MGSSRIGIPKQRKSGRRRRPPGRPQNLTARGRGRPKGATNLISRTAREIIAEAADIVGGAKQLAKWAMKNNNNESMFWTTVYPRLLPLENRHADSGVPLIGVQIISYKEIDDANAKTIEAAAIKEEGKDQDT